MRSVATALLAFALATPLAAQAPVELPPGWALRLDPGQQGAPAPAPTGIMFMSMGSGFHVMSGPAAIYYREDEPVTGAYTLSAKFSQTRSAGQEAYGLVLGGSDLQAYTQNYLYFLIRPADGGILINHRTSDEAPRSIVAWTPSAAVKKQSGSGATSNELAVQVTADAVRFLVNGTEVRRLSRAELGGASTDGLVGVRINHNLELMVEGFGVRR